MVYKFFSKRMQMKASAVSVQFTQLHTPSSSMPQSSGITIKTQLHLGNWHGCHLIALTNNNNNNIIDHATPSAITVFTTLTLPQVRFGYSTCASNFDLFFCEKF